MFNYVDKNTRKIVDPKYKKECAEKSENYRVACYLYKIITSYKNYLCKDDDKKKVDKKLSGIRNIYPDKYEVVKIQMEIIEIILGNLKCTNLSKYNYLIYNIKQILNPVIHRELINRLIKNKE